MLGEFAIAQADPSQCSINVWSVEPVSEKPTLQHSVDDAQITPRRRFRSAEPVLGEETRLQVLPFQCSITVWSVVPLSAYPTAQQSAAEVHVTPVSTLGVNELVLAEATIAHAEPFQCSVKVW